MPIVAPPVILLPVGASAIARIPPRRHPYRFQIELIQVRVDAHRIEMAATDGDVAALLSAPHAGTLEPCVGAILPEKCKDGASVALTPFTVEDRLPPIREAIRSQFAGGSCSLEDVRALLRGSTGDVVDMSPLVKGRGLKLVEAKRLRKVAAMLGKLGADRLELAFAAVFGIRAELPDGGEVRISLAQAEPH